MTATKVTTVASRTNAVTRLTRNRRPNDNLINTELFESTHPKLIDHGPGIKNDLIGAWLADIPSHNTTQHPIGERLDNVATINNGRHNQPFIGATVLLGHNNVLCDIHQTTRQIPRVGGLECRIGQAFTSTVGGDEVLQNVKAFAEVRHNWRLDDRAVRLGHQAPHTRQLTDLGWGASCA